MTVMTNELLLPIWSLTLWLVATFALLLAVVIVVVRSRAQLRIKEGEWQVQLAELMAKLSAAENEIASFKAEKQRFLADLAQANQQNHELKLDLATARARFEEKEQAWQSELNLLKSSREILAKEFESLANRVFEAKQEHFSRHTKIQLEQLILPFRDQLKEFRDRTDEAQKQGIAQHHQLMGQIFELQKQSQQIGQDAVNLANALKGNNKIIGNWGELILANILENMGLQKGREYQLQVSHRDDDGRRIQPDAVVYLPDEKSIVIDAKVSLVAYERFCIAESEQERAQALKEHVESIRTHIRGLAAKNYADVVSKGSIDFVCMFVPVEAAFITAVQNVPELLQEAYDKRVLLVSPSGIFVVLRTVSALWQRERQDRNVENIVVSAGRLHDQFVRFVEALEDIGVGLERVGKSYELAMSRLVSGSGNLVKRVDDFRKLGAKTSKKFSSTIAERACLDAEAVEDPSND